MNDCEDPFSFKPFLDLSEIFGHEYILKHHNQYDKCTQSTQNIKMSTKGQHSSTNTRCCIRNKNIYSFKCLICIKDVLMFVSKHRLSI